MRLPLSRTTAVMSINLNIRGRLQNMTHSSKLNANPPSKIKKSGFVCRGISNAKGSAV